MLCTCRCTHTTGHSLLFFTLYSYSLKGRTTGDAVARATVHTTERVPDALPTAQRPRAAREVLAWRDSDTLRVCLVPPSLAVTTSHVPLSSLLASSPLGSPLASALGQVHGNTRCGTAYMDPTRQPSPTPLDIFRHCIIWLLASAAPIHHLSILCAGLRHHPRGGADTTL